ncbi:MAG TPA: single-stranded-DNA-specific exonuclease RecJ, partial [Roseiflexaceae bacterium]|nr:single-stranded-DNA-specific exonuclease RecJ [Roseiflexaceae bacterium]
MSARKKRWVLRDPAPADFLATVRDYSPLAATLLYQRGMRDKSSIAAFLSTDYKRGFHDPFLLKGMDVAARRVAAAIAEGETIVVYGDFDTDGVTAVTLLMQAIGAMGGDIRPYIPHRLREGYGLNSEAIEQMAAEGVRLLITVDCGISNVGEVALAQERGIDVIVTDHHTPPPILPEAFAVVNPKQPGCEYPYKQLVGVGIAYKLVQALARLGVKMPLRGRDLLDVVALGTVTDMGPLNGENRVLVQAGLESINTTQRPGLKALILAAGLVQGKISAGDISFMLGPRLNAAGRIDDALLAYQLLLADDFTAARALADTINQANRRRQDLTKEIQGLARRQAEELGKRENRIVVLDGAEYPAGLVGLVAAKLVEELGRPVLLIERGPETSRGSARSIPGFNMIEALAACDELFARYGGHSAAAGFTIATERLPELEARLLDYAATRLPDQMLVPALEIDADVPLGALNWQLLEQIAVLEPFGQSNPQPVLMSRRVRVASSRATGAEGQHLKLRL